MKNVKYVLYARKSTESEDKQIQSIDAQIDEMKNIAKAKHIKVVEVLKESKSAKAPFCRPEFNKMIKLIESGKASGILCWEISRISRNPAEAGMIQQMLQDEKIECIRTYNRTYYPDDNAVIFGVEASISNQFIRDLRKNVKRGIAAKAKAGGISGPAPQGYKNNVELKTIEIDKKRFHIVRKIFDMYLQGYSVPVIKRVLDDIGYLTPQSKKKKMGGKPLGTSMIYNILQNSRYAAIVRDPFNPDVTYEGNYQAMITKEEYDEVQKLLGKKGKPRLCASKYFALKGLIRCGDCGCMITAQTKRKKLISGKTNYHTYYHCTKKKPCSQRGNVKENDLFDMVDSLLGKYELTPKLYEWGIQALNEIAQREIKERNDIQILQFEKTKDIQTRLDKFLDLAVRGSITAEKYEEMAKPLEAELAERQQEQKDAMERSKNWYEFVGKTLDELTNAKDKFARGDLIEKNRILQAIGENPVLFDGKLRITSYEWLKPIENGLIEQNVLSEMVRTGDLQIENAPEEAKKLAWYPGLDSNQRPEA